MAETLFSIANLTAMAAWVALILARFVKPLRGFVDPATQYVVPALFALAYGVLFVMFAGGAEGGGFSSLAGVAALFAKPELLLAGWIHYLAFDLFVGGWIARQADEIGLWPVFTAPILVLTFMLGPLGYLVFAVIRLFMKRKSA